MAHSTVASFWDTIKPSTPPPAVVDFQVAKDARSIRLVWSDGKQVTLPTRMLRQACPCAGCVDEWTNQRTLNVEKVPEDIRLAQVAPVGNYALSLSFSDQHSTGIYPWVHLRQLFAPKAP